MPSLQRRREEDIRGQRFESEIRNVEMPEAMKKIHERKGLLYCTRTGKTFEEHSQVCPRCDKKDCLRRIKSVPGEFLDQFRNRAIRKTMERNGL